MEMEALQIPILYGRVAIAVAALAHALCATFIVGSSVIGAAMRSSPCCGHRSPCRAAAPNQP